MIFLFRKEIKKWNKIWWVVLASLAMGGAMAIFFRTPDKSSIKIASVDGSVISLKEFQHVYAESKASLDDLARYWGIPAERLAQMMGMGNIARSSLDKCVNNFLLDTIASSFSIRIDHKSFQDSLATTISKAFVDPSGKVNVEGYQNYLSRLHMSIADYEERKESEFKRNLLVKALGEGGYVPAYVGSDMQLQKSGKKKFLVLTLPFDHFVAQAKSTAAKDEDLKKYFKDNRENYRIAEKRKARYWVLSPEDYKKKVSIDDSLIERFYEKNKSMYRIPPKVKVRLIVVSTKEKADELLAQMRKAPDTFAKVAKEHSKDAKTASNGGLIDFFVRGTYDPDFERVAFLSLKNVGDISDVVKTKRGFEIVKLEDRIAAADKPLDKVKDEIVKTLIDRKSLVVLRGDLEAVVRAARTNSDIFEKFAKDNALTAVDTEWLTQADAQGYEFSNMVAQKLFAGTGKARAKSNGYFVHQGKHVLYSMTSKEESVIPEFVSVKERIEKDWFEQQAKKLRKDLAISLKRDLLAKKTSLEEAGKKYNFSLLTTGLVAVDESIDGLKDAGSIVSEAFSLSDPSQLLEHKHESNLYLVQLVASEPGEAKIDASADSLGAEQKRRKQRSLDGFIASLRRNAKIEIDEKILKAGGYY